MSDTSAEAVKIQDAVHRRLTGAARLRIALDMSETVRELARARLRSQHPEWDARRLALELLRLVCPGLARLPG